jgi:hypothetical protein
MLLMNGLALYTKDILVQNYASRPVFGMLRA